MIALQLGQALSIPGVVVGLVALVAVIVVVRFVISLAIKAAIIGLVLLGAVFVLNQLGLGVPGIGGLLIAG